MLFSFNILTEEILVQVLFFLIQNVKMPKYEQTFFFLNKISGGAF